MDFVDEEEISSLLLSVDFEKAFDRLSALGLHRKNAGEI